MQLKLNIMKKILFITILTLAFYNCKAQSQILDIDKIGWKNIDNAYYKDTNDILNNFTGTWLYTSGNTSLKIKLVKITQYFNGTFYEDLLIGGYLYIENGIEKINTLSDADNPSIGRNASIKGNNIYNNCKYLPVNDCSEGERNLNLSIKDVTSNGHIGDLRIFKRIINGKQAFKINIEMNYLLVSPPDGKLPNPTLPWQMHDIVFIKQ